MTSKGQAVTLLGVTMLLMFGAGGFLGALSISDTLTETVNVNSGEVSVITETKIRAEYYPERMKTSMGYSYNTSTYLIGKEGGGESIWTDDTTRSEIVNNLEENLTGDMKERNKIANCEGPRISSSTIDSLYSTISLQNNKFICNGEFTTVTVSVSSTIRMEHINNPYIAGGTPEQGHQQDDGMVGGAFNINNAIEEQVQHQVFDASRSACESNIDDYEEDLEEPAKNSAESSGKNHYDSSLIDLSHVENNMIDTLSASVKGASVSGVTSASRRVEENDCYLGCTPDGDGGCTEEYEDRITAEAEYNPSSVTWDIEISDSAEMITAKGFVNLLLDYSYLQSF